MLTYEMTTKTFSAANICRVCETETSENSLVLEENKPIVKKLRACADISIDLNDDLPKFLCTKCLSELEYAYTFKIKCEYTDRKLRDAIESGKIPSVAIKIEQQRNDSIKNETLHQTHVETMLTASEIDDYNIEYCTNDDEEEADTEEIEMVESIDDDQIIHTDVEYLDDYGDEPEDEQTLYVDNGDMVSVGSSTASGILEGEILETMPTEMGTDDASTDMVNSVIEDDSQIELKYSEVEVLDEATMTPKRRRSSKVFQCDTCAITFLNFAEFHQHNKTHGKNRYQCTMCDRWFSKRYHLKNHITIHAKQKLFSCDLCPNKYSNRGNLDRHVRVFHNKIKTHACNDCGKSFSQITILRQHMATHTTERNFECDICQKRFKTEAYLNLHRNRHMPGAVRRRPSKRTSKAPKQPPKPCVCTECGKQFNSMTLYLSHRRTHSGEKPYSCNVCQRQFSFQQSLRNHKLLHTGEKPFRCDICHLTFRQIAHLKGHKLVHTKEKNHPCLVCGKAFSLKGNLTIHMRLHTGETPYHCPVCPKKFYDSNGLKRHKQIHERTKLATASTINNAVNQQSTIESNIIAPFDLTTNTIDDGEDDEDSAIMANNLEQYKMDSDEIVVLIQ